MIRFLVTCLLIFILSFITLPSSLAKPLTDSELATIVANNFPTGTTKSGEDIRQVAFAIAFAESSGRPDVTSKTGDVGLWQINLKSHPEYDADKLKDPNYNAKAAVEISKNGESWKAWSAYKNGAYKKYMDKAKEALRKCKVVYCKDTRKYIIVC